MKRPPEALTGFIRAIDAVGLWSGKIVAWLIIPMVASLVYEVAARYLFNAPTEWAYDMTFMLYGSFFMLGAAYTLQQKGHIRTDFYYGRWSVKRQGWTDTACYVLFFFPAMLMIFLSSVDEAWHAFRIWERSEQTAWQPILWPFKAVVPVTAVLLMVQGVSELLKSLHAARTGEAFERRDGVSV